MGLFASIEHSFLHRVATRSIIDVIVKYFGV